MRKYILITLATITLASCLDENPRDRLTEEEAFKTSTDLYLNTVANLYNYIGGHEDGQGLQGTTRGIYDLNTFTSDEGYISPVVLLVDMVPSFLYIRKGFLRL